MVPVASFVNMESFPPERWRGIFYQALGDLKACVCNFDSSSKTMKNAFLFHLKNSCCSGDNHIFVFPSSPLFLPVSHCFGGWLKIILKVYDVINCLNKNLITHFVWYLEKEKKYDIETLSIDKVLNKEYFYEKIENVYQ